MRRLAAPRRRSARATLVAFVALSAWWLATGPPAVADEDPAPLAPVRLLGTVREAGLRKAIVGATVRLDAPGAVAPEPLVRVETDGDGRFAVRLPEGGRVRVTLSALGYKPLTVEETLPAGVALEVDYRLYREARAPRYQSTVRGGRPREEIARIPISQEEVAKIPGTNGDALRAVTNLPGVARAAFDAGLLVIRGAAPGDTVVQLGGHTLPLYFHFGGFTSVWNTELLESIDFIPGNFSVRYGRAIGGVIDIVPRAGTRDGYHGYVKLDFVDAGFKVEGPVGKGSFAIAARRSVLEAVLPFVANLVGASFTLVPRYYDYQATFDYPLGGGRFKLLVYGSDDESSLYFKDTPDTDPGLRGQFGNRDWFHALHLRYERKWKDAEVLATMNAGPQHDDGRAGPSLGYALDVVTIDARLEGRFRINDHLRLLAGIDLSLDWYQLSGKAPYLATESQVQPPITTQAKRPFAESAWEANPAAYVEARIDWKRLVLLPGLRVDYFNGERVTFDPRLNALVEVAPRTFLKAGVGLFHQPSLPPYSDAVVGNPKLRPQQALQLSIGVDTAPIPKMPELRAELTFYYKDLRNLAEPSDALVVRGGALVPERYKDTGIGRIYGMDLLVRREMSKWLYGWVAYTLLRSERNDDPANPVSTWRPFQYDQTHILTVAATAKLPHDVEVGLRFRYVTGSPDTPVKGSLYLSDYDTYLPVYGPVYSTRLPDFSALDLRIDKRITFRSWVLSIYLDVRNVYNARNVEQYIYSYDYQKRAALTGIPVFPSLGIKGEL